jgi:hypothetical protein
VTISDFFGGFEISTKFFIFDISIEYFLEQFGVTITTFGNFKNFKTLKTSYLKGLKILSVSISFSVFSFLLKEATVPAPLCTLHTVHTTGILVECLNSVIGPRVVSLIS